MAGYLRKINAPCSLLEIYGLFHGCVAAPVMVPPSRYIHMILGEEALDTDKQVSHALSNLLALWNRIAQWKPAAEPFMKPVISYPTTREGLRDRVANWYSFTEFFINGLAMGETSETDFSKDAAEAMRSFTEAQIFLEDYSELLKKTPASEKDFEDSHEILGKMEEVIGDCVTRVYVDDFVKSHQHAPCGAPRSMTSQVRH